MEIVEFEKEVMFLLKKHYKDTEMIGARNWFDIKISSLYKDKVIQLTILEEGRPTIDASANNYDELFINTLYLLRDHLVKNPYKNILCDSCKGKGEYENYGGSGHSWTEKCSKCNGAGKKS